MFSGGVNVIMIYFTYNSRFGVFGSNDLFRILSRDVVDVRCFFKFLGFMCGENIRRCVVVLMVCVIVIFVLF